MTYSEAIEKIWFNFLLTNLRTLLGDSLGQYELISKPTVTTPSIIVQGAELKGYRIKENSGIECIIQRSIQQIPGAIIHNSTVLGFIFSIELRQHNPNASLNCAVSDILLSKKWDIQQIPVITPRTEISNGVAALERAIIKIEVYQFVGKQ